VRTWFALSALGGPRGRNRPLVEFVASKQSYRMLFEAREYGPGPDDEDNDLGDELEPILRTTPHTRPPARVGPGSV
jgi:hypothetical protein